MEAAAAAALALRFIIPAGPTPAAPSVIPIREEESIANSPKHCLCTAVYAHGLAEATEKIPPPSVELCGRRPHMHVTRARVSHDDDDDDARARIN